MPAFDAVEMHDRGDGIEERQLVLAGELLDGRGERPARSGARWR